ncbi:MULTISPECIES: hypothetical protein [Pseudescherichia]|uniref:hypothetical protein n=1 Tax=Pseudescherichia TaxID=2055880 RepID=UPI0021504098|nr:MULTISPECIES: hypothetical protein [unclassified Pseudescherichia]MCR4457466.1 hypothetical protein [Pseudescherichia sp. L3]MDF2777906.1 Uncharacterized protein [Enterobacteriaceae bacterium]
MKKYLFALPAVLYMALPCLISPAYAAPAVRSVDVKSFDVAGVKTGMSVEEARAAMQKNFGVSADAIRTSTFRKDQIAYLVTGNIEVSNLIYEKDGTRMQVSFEPRVPYDKNNPMAVSLINYEIPWTKENETAMKEAAIAKYGPISTGGMAPEWCDKPLPTSGMGCEPDSATLKVGSTHLSLFDPAWKNAVSKFMDQKRATKPQF